MSKLEETNSLIDYATEIMGSTLKGNNMANTMILADIAKSLAMIADKLCGTDAESEDKT